MDKVNRYLVRRELGRGGFGTVYQAWDPVVCRDVAIKVLASVSDPSMLARFRTEAGTTGSLKHKNIITIHDFGEHDSVPYIVMELLEGRSLREVIAAGVQVSLSEKIVIMVEIARGLLFAHQNGVIHRDIKPANIMLLADGTVKILDFGIARMVDQSLTRHTVTGMIVGTVEYMSPEQLLGEDADALCDIFSYGVLCYELLSGKQPFRASNLPAVVNLITTKNPEPLRTLLPDCPEKLESIVQMAMAKRRSERYQSLQDLLFDLAPIEAELRKNRADMMAAEAQQLLEAGDTEGTLSKVRCALELDPAHPASQELRRRIQRQRERLALEQRLSGGVKEADRLLQRGSFDEAIQGLEAMREWLGSDTVHDLRANLEGRLSAARDMHEKARPPVTPLVEAHEATGRRDLATPDERTILAPRVQPTRDGGGLRKYAAPGGAAVILLAGLAYFVSSRHDPEIERLRNKSYTNVSDPDFSNCRGVQTCIDEKAQAEKLLAIKDWANEPPYNSPLFSDCMGYEPCVRRKDQAGKLSAIKDWSKLVPDDKVLNDCMGYEPCLGAHRKPGPSTEPVTHPPPPPPRPVSCAVDTLPDCCKDSTNPEACRTCKTHEKVQDHCSGLFKN